MKIACVCCTYNRPRQLGRLIRCFERQSYPDRELIILDDAGQYRPQSGDRWRLVVEKKRYQSLAHKRNAVAALASPDCDAFAVWDDDDLYLPWALWAHAAALRDAEWSRPSLVLHPEAMADGTGVPRWRLKRHETGGLYHGGWAYTRRAFDSVGGYPKGWSGPEDQQFMRKMENARITQADPIALGFEPAYIYPWAQNSGSYHISGLLTGRDQGQSAWKKLGTQAIDPAELLVRDPYEFDLSHPEFVDGVFPRPF